MLPLWSPKRVQVFLEILVGGRQGHAQQSGQHLSQEHEGVRQYTVMIQRAETSAGPRRRQGGRVASLHPGTRTEPAGQSNSQVSVSPMVHFRRLCRALDRHYSILTYSLVFLAGMLATLLCVALTSANQYL
uniref:Uncharacterized protein n=1 Tax=Drosophila pseudoobscura pseudoobscura TaxID=46245 RepID=A0A0R3NW61_DROPS